MKTTMTTCDNPQCKSIGVPERPEHEGDKKYLPPYGWLTMKGYFIGCGPNVAIEVCSATCAGPAIIAVAEEAERN